MKIATILNKEILVLKILLSLSFATNGYCFMQVQNQNLYIKTLLEKNNSLITSIEEIQQSLNLLEQKQQLISNPVVIDNVSDTFLKNPLLVIGALTLGIGVAYYVSTVIISKVSTVAFYSTLKVHNLTYLLEGDRKDLDKLNGQQTIPTNNDLNIFNLDTINSVLNFIGDMLQSLI